MGCRILAVFQLAKYYIMLHSFTSNALLLMMQYAEPYKMKTEENN
ncbi:hypothetical protein T11_15414 [Trichinella zimbabwensis]|uniref:Uncharacterized protein n=1 Tax=Trichinella zimbabwensis TaxID=268475 RepID=A0A0V1GIG5_9BILA|nr:hypothetical protein T11_15414 [Trichinella zimbabwensis]